MLQRKIHIVLIICIVFIMKINCNAVDTHLMDAFDRSKQQVN